VLSLPCVSADIKDAERVASVDRVIGALALLRMAVGQTDELDGEFAAGEVLRQCADALGGQEPQAGLLLASHDLDFEEFLSVVTAAYPGMGLIGCTTIAPMSSVADYEEGSTTLTLFSSDILDFTVGLGTDVVAGVGSAARRAVEEATGKTDKQPALMVVTPTVERFDPTAITIEIGEILGRAVPVIGGGSAPDFPMVMPWLGGFQFYGDQVLTDSLPVLLISGPLKVSVGVAHGWSPVGKTAVVTRSNDYKVYEIDGEPILDFYQRYLGVGTEPAVANPLAILDEETGRYFLRAALQYDESDGSATFFGSVPQGATVQLAMATIDEILGGTEASVAEALASFPGDEAPEAALIASCGVRNFLLGTRTRGEIERIRTGLGQDLPVSGFYGFGEIAPLGVDATPSFHNETCVTVLIGT
jgi:hypothetical protein